MAKDGTKRLVSCVISKCRSSARTFEPAVNLAFKFEKLYRSFVLQTSTLDFLLHSLNKGSVLIEQDVDGADNNEKF